MLSALRTRIVITAGSTRSSKEDGHLPGTSTRGPCAARALFASLCALLAAAACSPAHDASRESAEAAAQLAAISLINHGAPDDTVWVLRTTDPYSEESLRWIANAYRNETSAGAVEDFVAANRRSTQVRVPPLLDGRVVVVADSVAPWSAEPATPVTSVSRAGLSAKRDTALVEVKRICGPTCGSTALLVLVRDSTGWKGRGALRNAQF